MAKAKTSRARWPWTAARVTCSCAALLWVLHATPLRTIVTTLREADLSWLIIGLTLNLFTRLASAERTQVTSRALGLVVSRWQTIETLFISNFYALLSPGPVLSGVVTVYRYKSYGASIPGSVGLVLASRAIECATFIALGTGCLLMDSRVSLAAVQYPLALAMAALLATGVGIACWWFIHRRWTRRVTQNPTLPMAGSGYLAQLRAVWHEIMSRGPRMAWQAAIPATAQVILSGAALAVLARSLGIELSLLTAIWLSAAVYAVVLLPISVAGLGVREVTLLNALGLLGVTPRLAVALSVLLFADPLINALIGGLLQLRSAVNGAQPQA
jgi:uncharacterized membrane protein YbhN (UPF0104 family)